MIKYKKGDGIMENKLPVPKDDEQLIKLISHMCDQKGKMNSRKILSGLDSGWGMSPQDIARIETFVENLTSYFDFFNKNL